MSYVVPNPTDRTEPANPGCPGAVFYADGTVVSAPAIGGRDGTRLGVTYGVTEGGWLGLQAVKWDDGTHSEVAPTILEVVTAPMPLPTYVQEAMEARVHEAVAAYLDGTDEGFEGIPTPDDHNIGYRLRAMPTPPDVVLYPRIRVEIDRRTDERNTRVLPGVPPVEVAYQSRGGGYPYPRVRLNPGDLVMGDATHWHMDRARVISIEETVLYGRPDIWVKLAQRSYSPTSGKWSTDTHYETAREVGRAWIKVA
jgi:hypothetical protein